MTDFEIRAMLCRALEAGAVSKVYESVTRQMLLETGEDIDIASLDMDSLGRMEFSIAVEIETGVSLTPDDLLHYKTINQLVGLFRDQ